ncbi:unnamed protein product, partial [Prorocentrum cordatum]
PGASCGRARHFCRLRAALAFEEISARAQLLGTSAREQQQEDDGSGCSSWSAEVSVVGAEGTRLTLRPCGARAVSVLGAARRGEAVMLRSGGGDGGRAPRAALGRLEACPV